MKTFKLKSLNIIEDTNEDIIHKDIPLIDGLIINREDDLNQWVVEAFIDKVFFTYFETLKATKNEVMIQVKITKETNAPAIFITTIIGLNEIETHMNVLFKGTIVDHHKEEIEEMLQSLIEKDFQGEALLMEFKKQMRKNN